jgi:pimeloyl-ACP methyl ester carboxylesterase
VGGHAEERKPRAVVVFIHGWTATSPFEWHQVWLDHLLARGSAVIFPVYQTSGDDSEFVTSPYNLRDGLEAGFRAFDGAHLPVVVAGYSVGGALAFYYAAAARRWHLPDPVAVYSIFPFDPLRIDPGLSLLGEPPGHVRVLMLVGDMDTTVGRYGGDTFWKWLANVPPELKTYRLLRSQKHGSLWFDHEAPTDVFDATMRNVFWEPVGVEYSDSSRFGMECRHRSA